MSRIGTKLYLALGFAVMLTLLSSAVGIYYFERSGDLSHALDSESVPALEDAWKTAELAHRLSSLGTLLLADARRGVAPEDAEVSQQVLAEIRRAVARPAGLEGLEPQAQSVYDDAAALVDLLDRLAAQSAQLASHSERVRELRAQLAEHPATDADYPVLALLLSALGDDRAPASQIDHWWNRYGELATRPGVSSELRELAESADGVFAVREAQLEGLEALDAAAPPLFAASQRLSESASRLRESVSARSDSDLAASVSSFDQGRLILAGICLASVLVATLVAWLWVGNNVVRRLSRLSTRMRAMAGGDLATAVPEVGHDEIGQLADALEVFRRQALEVQRLNLVERLYGELTEAYQELESMQARLVAQEKLAALGEIVSGVAHEISNPLNFVQNFSEGSGELSEELFEMLDSYRDDLAGDDLALLDDIKGELSDSLERIQANSRRALTIVQRMQSLGVAGGAAELTDLHPVLTRAVNLGCEFFASEWGDFAVTPEFSLDAEVRQAALVPSDFSEAVVNLVTNACYAMRSRRESGEHPGYEPALLVATHLRDGEVAVVIADNGTGISDEILPRIFNPFFTTRDGALGAGLGLPLAADVARRGGGDLTVETEFGSGSRFTLTAPLSPPAGPAEALAERFGSDVSVVRSFAAAEPAGGKLEQAR